MQLCFVCDNLSLCKICCIIYSINTGADIACQGKVESEWRKKGKKKLQSLAQRHRVQSRCKQTSGGTTMCNTIAAALKINWTWNKCSRSRSANSWETLWSSQKAKTFSPHTHTHTHTITPHTCRKLSLVLAGQVFLVVYFFWSSSNGKLNI